MQSAICAVWCAEQSKIVDLSPCWNISKYAAIRCLAAFRRWLVSKQIHNQNKFMDFSKRVSLASCSNFMIICINAWCYFCVLLYSTDGYVFVALVHCTMQYLCVVFWTAVGSAMAVPASGELVCFCWTNVAYLLANDSQQRPKHCSLCMYVRIVVIEWAVMLLDRWRMAVQLSQKRLLLEVGSLATCVAPLLLSTTGRCHWSLWFLAAFSAYHCATLYWAEWTAKPIVANCLVCMFNIRFNIMHTLAVVSYVVIANKLTFLVRNEKYTVLLICIFTSAFI